MIDSPQETLWKYNIPALNSRNLDLNKLPPAMFEAELSDVMVDGKHRGIQANSSQGAFHFQDEEIIHFEFKLTVLGVKVTIKNLEKEDTSKIKVKRDRICFYANSISKTWTFGKDVLDSIRKNKHYIPLKEFKRRIEVSNGKEKSDIIIPYDLIEVYSNEVRQEMLIFPCSYSPESNIYYFVKEFLIKHPQQNRPGDGNVFIAESFDIILRGVQFDSKKRRAKRDYKFVFKVKI